MIVKICGVTRPEDAEVAAQAGADWIGLNFWPQSRRFVTAAQAAAIAEAIPGDVKKVGVFVNAAAPAVKELVATLGLDLVQFHGDEDAAYLAAYPGRWIKAIRVRDASDLRALDALGGAEAILLDTPSEHYGGSGRTFDWSLVRGVGATPRRIVLAGGLTAENVARAVREVRPFGVDVAGGVESAPGLKDPDAVRRFVRAAKEAAGARGSKP